MHIRIIRFVPQAKTKGELSVKSFRYNEVENKQINAYRRINKLEKFNITHALRN